MAHNAVMNIIPFLTRISWFLTVSISHKESGIFSRIGVVAQSKQGNIRQPVLGLLIILLQFFSPRLSVKLDIPCLQWVLFSHSKAYNIGPKFFQFQLENAAKFYVEFPGKILFNRRELLLISILCLCVFLWIIREKLSSKTKETEEKFGFPLQS